MVMSIALLLAGTSPFQAFQTSAGIVIHRPDRQAVTVSGWQAAGWSLSSRWMAVRQGSKLALLDLEPAEPKLIDLGQTTGKPRWSPDGEWLAFPDSKGILLISPAKLTEPVRLTSDGTAPTWAYDSQRIAFIRASKKGSSVHIASRQGQSAQTVWTGPALTDLAWSPSGLWIAAESATKTILLSPDGRTVKDGPAGDLLGWSPGSRFLLLSRKTGLSLYEPATGLKREISAAVNPVWASSRKLMGIVEGKLQACDVLEAEPKWSPAGDKSPAGALAYWAPPVISLDRTSQTETNAFQGAPNPKRGEMRCIGSVVEVDPYEGTFKVRVHTVLTPGGREILFPSAFVQEFEIVNRSQIVTQKASGTLRPMDLRPEGEIAVICDGLEIKSARPKEAVSVFVPNWDGVILGPNPGNRPKRALDYDQVSHEKVVVPMIFPIIGKPTYLRDSFLASRGGGTRRHKGQDIMAEKMRPVVACFDGVVRLIAKSSGNAGYYIKLKGDNGWTVNYMHINNDTPGTNDGQGGLRYAFAPGLRDGDRVVAGQFLGWNGNSGNAEPAAGAKSQNCHVHFELWDDVGGGCLNAYPSLMAARTLSEPVAPTPLPFLPLKPQEAHWRGVVVAQNALLRSVTLDRMAEQVGQKTRVETKPARQEVSFEAVKPAGSNPDQGSIVRVQGLQSGTAFRAAVLTLERRGR